MAPGRPHSGPSLPCSSSERVSRSATGVRSSHVRRRRRKRAVVPQVPTPRGGMETPPLLNRCGTVLGVHFFAPLDFRGCTVHCRGHVLLVYVLLFLVAFPGVSLFRVIVMQAPLLVPAAFANHLFVSVLFQSSSIPSYLCCPFSHAPFNTDSLCRCLLSFLILCN